MSGIEAFFERAENPDSLATCKGTYMIYQTYVLEACPSCGTSRPCKTYHTCIVCALETQKSDYKLWVSTDADWELKRDDKLARADLKAAKKYKRSRKRSKALRIAAVTVVGFTPGIATVLLLGTWSAVALTVTLLGFSLLNYPKSLEAKWQAFLGRAENRRRKRHLAIRKKRDLALVSYFARREKQDNLYPGTGTLVTITDPRAELYSELNHAQSRDDATRKKRKLRYPKHPPVFQPVKRP